LLLVYTLKIANNRRFKLFWWRKIAVVYGEDQPLTPPSAFVVNIMQSSGVPKVH